MAGLMLLLPVMTLGIVIVSPFSDVDPSNPYFNNIVAMANSGISSGCGGGRFCPATNVTREQMAAFLNRAAPRESSTTFDFPLGFSATPANNSVVATVTAKSLNNEYLSISAAFYDFITADAGTYPCEDLYEFYVDGTNYGADSMYSRAVAAPVANQLNEIAGLAQVAVGAGTHTVQLRFFDGSGTCINYPGRGTMTVQVIPFSGDLGSISVLTPAVSSKTRTSSSHP
jgi:hypothetical protein